MLEEFCFPVEYLALTVEEVMHIHQVLVKAELEKYQQYKDVYTALKKGKVELLMVDGPAGLEEWRVTGRPCRHCLLARWYRPWGVLGGKRLTLWQPAPVLPVHKSEYFYFSLRNGTLEGFKAPY